MRPQPGADVTSTGLFGDFSGRLRLDLWRTADKAAEAAEAMRITASDLQAGRRRCIVPEPLGGAHRDPDGSIGATRGNIEELDGLSALGRDEILAHGGPSFWPLVTGLFRNRSQYLPFNGDF